MKESNFVFGVHSVEMLLKKNIEQVEQIFFLKNRHDKVINSLIDLAKNNKIRIEFYSRGDLDELVAGGNHQGVVAYCRKKKTYVEEDLADIIKQHASPLLLILDGVQDPHNLGACLRTADAAGVHAVIVPKDRSVGMTSTVIKVASGGAENIPFIQVTNLARTMKFLKEENIWLMGADANASQTLYEVDLKIPTALVLGAEGSGLRRLTKESCDFLLKIPLMGSVSSLNVSVATGIFLFEAIRQRRPF